MSRINFRSRSWWGIEIDQSSRRTRRKSAVLSLPLLLLAGPGQAQTGPAAAIVTNLSGATNPPVAVMSELSAGSQVTLAPGTVLTFMIYTTCTMVTVSGGTLGIGTADFTTNGTVLGRTAGPCPQSGRTLAAVRGSAGQGKPSAAGTVMEVIRPGPGNQLTGSRTGPGRAMPGNAGHQNRR
ncbi:MAG TPA: hypothetical protein VJ770_11910 [Stellaceae bacterium]|nr:hypothetical protein [Stellaceae bacterium]